MQTNELFREVCALNQRYVNLCKVAEDSQLADLSRRLRCGVPILYRLRELGPEQVDKIVRTPFCLVKATFTDIDLNAVRRPDSDAPRKIEGQFKQILRDVRALNTRYVQLCRLADKGELAETVLLLNIRFDVLRRLRDLSLDDLERLVATDRPLVQLAVDERAIAQAIRLDDLTARYTYLAASASDDGHELDRDLLEV